MACQLRISLLLNRLLALPLMISKSCQIKFFCGVVSVFVLLPVLSPFLVVARSQSLVMCHSGSRSSNLLRHLYKGFLPAVCSLPVPGYMVRLDLEIMCAIGYLFDAVLL